MGLITFFRNIRQRVQPKTRYNVLVRIWNESSKRYIGELTVTTDASSRKGAEENVQNNLRLHINGARTVRRNE
jgi:hypothetical protein